MSVKERLETYVKYKKLSNSAFCRSIGVSTAFISSMRVSLQPDKIESIALNYPELNTSWLLTGEGEMLKVSFDIPKQIREEKKLIPFYDDVTSIGGMNGVIADVNRSYVPTEWIDTGDWFPDATAAIRHYGDSMNEYPSGSILALKRVDDWELLIWGRNYAIETTEYRITKQLQDGGDHFIVGYSSNKETYPDGRQIHSPIKIPKNTIRNIDMVIGHVTKEYSSGAYQIK